MIPRVVLALAVVLALSAPASASTAAAYDVKAAPLDELSRDLLTSNGYEFRDDGKVWDKISEAPVAHAEMSYLLSHLAGARRLRALLQLNLILNRSEGEKKLTDAERESVRDIVRQNWNVFGVSTRRDFRSYFSVQELEGLDRIPPRFDKASALASMKDPEPESATAAPPPPATPPPATPPAPPPAPQAAVAALFPPRAPVTPAQPPAAAPAPAQPPAPAPAPYVPSLPPMMAPPSLRRASPFSGTGGAAPAPAAVATPPPAPAAPAAPAAPPSTPPAAAPAAATPAAPPARPAPAAPIAPVVLDQGLGVLKPWTPPAVSTAALAAKTAVEVATPTAAAAPPEPPKPAIPVIGAEQFDKFVAEGPYTAEGRALLKLLGQKAPDHCLPLLRRTVVSAMPLIVLDGARTGADLRAGLVVDAAKPDAPPVAALSPGAVYVERKSGLFGARQALLLPESPSFYAELGVPAPALDALRKDAVPTVVENGPWGATKVFADGSRRGSYSTQEQAGELLEQLLLLGLRRENLDASAYAAKRWTRTARLLFSARMKDEIGHDGFLDADRRAELREWLERPEEADDVTLSSWAGSRLRIIDPRRGTPEGARDFEARAQGSCVRAALEDALAEAAGRRARHVSTLETLLDAELASSAQAKDAASAAADKETAQRQRLLAVPPACPALDPGRSEALRKASLISAEALRAERVFREKKAGGSAHAD